MSCPTDALGFKVRGYMHMIQAMAKIKRLAECKTGRKALQPSEFLTPNTAANNYFITYLVFLLPWTCVNCNSLQLTADSSLLRGNPCKLCEILEYACRGEHPPQLLVQSYFETLDL